MMLELPNCDPFRPSTYFVIYTVHNLSFTARYMRIRIIQSDVPYPTQCATLFPGWSPCAGRSRKLQVQGLLLVKRALCSFPVKRKIERWRRRIEARGLLDTSEATNWRVERHAVAKLDAVSEFVLQARPMIQFRQVGRGARAR